MAWNVDTSSLSDGFWWRIRQKYHYDGEDDDRHEVSRATNSKAYIFVFSGKPRCRVTTGIKTTIIVLIGAVIILSTVASIAPRAEGHGVQAQLQSRFVRIQDETFSAQTVNTGDTITVSSTLQSLINRPARGWLSLFSESTNAGNRWEFISRDPPGNIIDIPAQGTIPYSITAKALEPGIYHVHTQLNLEHIGPGLGPGQTVQVTGAPIFKPVPWGNVA